MGKDELEEKIAHEIHDFHDEYTDPLLVNEILNGIDDLDNETDRSNQGMQEAAQQSLDPLERIDQEEKEISKNNEFSDLENKFVLSNNIAAINPQKFNNISYEPSVTISERLYNYSSNSGNFGTPRCISV